MSQKLYEEVFGGFSAEEMARLEEKKSGWLPEVEKILRKAAAKSESVLRLISGDENIVLKPVDNGSRTIAKASDVFTGGIDGDFEQWGLDKATGPTPVEVYELVNNATFEKMFASFDCELDLLVLTQDQVIGFCEDQRNWLHPEGWATFFLLKEGKKEFFVARVSAYDRGQLGVYVDRFGRGHVWYADRRYRVVVPQLSP